jgi:hypothetical protein
MLRGLWWGDLKERRKFEDLGADGRVLKPPLKEFYGGWNA